MSQLRFGKVAQIDIECEFGTIIDENCQDIIFDLSDLPNGIKLNSNVSFEIHLDEKGLIATNICEL